MAADGGHAMSRNKPKVARMKYLRIWYYVWFFAIPVWLFQAGMSSAQEVMRDENNMPIVAIVIVDGEDILEEPKRSAETVRRAGWLESFYICDRISISSQHYLQLAKVDLDSHYEITEIVGWIDEGHCLDRREALRTEHSIFEKAVIINRWEDSGGETTLEATPAFAGPGEAFKQKTKLGLFSFYYIFAKQRSSDDQEYVLLGHTSRIFSPAQADEVLIGWVPKNRIVEWNTRQGIQYDKSNLDMRGEPVRIFANERDSRLDIKGKTVLPIAVEDTSIKSWEYHWQRFPCFDQHSVMVSGEMASMMHIGYIGDRIEVDNSESSKRLSASDVSDLKKRLADLGKDVRKVDIVFVVDATGTMKRYFHSTRNAVLQIMQDLQDDFDPVDPKRPEFRFGVCFYRDYDYGPDLFDWQPLTNKTEIVQRFLDHGETLSRGDLNEAVFAGILEAVDKADFDDGFRAVVLLGDMGNDENDENGYDKQIVLNRLRDLNISLFVYHVVGKERLEEMEAEAFKRQVEWICQRLPAGDGSYFIEADPDSVSQIILKNIRSIRKMSKDAGMFVRELHTTGKSIVELRSKYGTILTLKLTRMMTDRGIDPGQFLNENVQLFETGWVAETNPRTGFRQIETMVLINRLEIQMLMGILAGFTFHVPTPESIQNLWTDVLRTQLSEFIDPERPVEEYLKQHLGLPVRENLLKRSLSELSQLSPNELSELRIRLIECKDHLNNINNEVEVEFREKLVPNPDGTMRRKRVKEIKGTRKYWWESEGIEFAWLQLEDLP
jgi:hypothetical protein